ncbi:SH3 domain-containing protein [Treponema zioleckii]|uniref:SH3 domain-containing protein n=1 Tax=Treponema zioleckii TaxID=331680 RepID=UPI00168B330A|nr:SH3 domain-containing protein [Treponema zioleckii]
MKRLILISVLISVCFTFWGQEKHDKTSNGYEITDLQSPIIKFVNIADGSKLNYRSAPVNGKKLGQFFNGTKLEITKQTNKNFTIDGITEVWYYAKDMEDVPPGEGWVFGGYLSDTEPFKNSLKKDEIDLNWLIGNWENSGMVVYIKADGHFYWGIKESEGFSGTWSILEDGTLYIPDAVFYDDPFTVAYKIKVCSPNRLVLVRDDGQEFEFHTMTSR